MSISIDDAEVAIAIAFLVMLFFVCVTMRTFVCWLRFYFVVEVGNAQRVPSVWRFGIQGG